MCTSLGAKNEVGKIETTIAPSRHSFPLKKKGRHPQHSMGEHGLYRIGIAF
jgi:hypothetical protein